MTPQALIDWERLRRFVNQGPTMFAEPGIRDPDNVCESYDGKGYTGIGRCESDGHYECTNCSLLSPNAPRFNWDREGRADRLRLFWARPR